MTFVAGSILRAAELNALPAYIRDLAAPSIIETMKPRLSNYSPYTAGYTFHNTFAMESHWEAVRFIAGNDQTGATWALDRFAVAPSAKINDGFNPVTAAGVAVPWTPGTCNNAGADVLLGAQASGSTEGMTLAAATDATNPTLSATDWMVAPSLDCADVGASLPLLMVRAYSASGRRGATNGAGDFNDADKWKAADQGRIIRSFYKLGDFVTAPSGFTSPAEASFLPFLAVQSYRRGRGFSVMTLGDSLTQGFLTTASNNGFGIQACAALSTPAVPVSHINSGWQGQIHAAIMTRGYREIALFRPHAVIIETSSPNSAPATQAEFDTMLSAALAFAEYAQSRGVVPILKTATPFQYSSGPDAFRLATNARVNAIGASGQMLVLDAAAAVTDGATPARVATAYQASDGHHINDAGHAAIAAEALAPLRAAMGL